MLIILVMRVDPKARVLAIDKQTSREGKNNPHKRRHKFYMVRRKPRSMGPAAINSLSFQLEDYNSVNSFLSITSFNSSIIYKKKKRK